MSQRAPINFSQCNINSPLIAILHIIVKTKINVLLIQILDHSSYQNNIKIKRNHQCNINSHSYWDSAALPDQTYVIPKIRQKLQLSSFSEILYLFRMQMMFNLKSPLFSHTGNIQDKRLAANFKRDM